MSNTTNIQTETPRPVRCSAWLGVGDRVTWLHVTQNGSSMRFQTREGKIVHVNGAMAHVKQRNGRETHVLVEMLRKDGEKNHVTEIFESMAKPPNVEPSEVADGRCSD